MHIHHKVKEKEIHSVNGVFCPKAYRKKLQYESEVKALNAIKFGNGDIIRAYYCTACRCWHTTSKPDQSKPWAELSEFIHEMYQIPIDDITEMETVEEDKGMVVVKIVENDALGKVVLPGYFPVGILAKRFGYVRQVLSDNHTRMTDIRNYLVLDEGKLVVKKVKDRDKEGFLRSFAARLEEEFEATNAFTMEHEIFPKDIVREEERDEFVAIAAEDLKEIVESRVRQECSPLDASKVSEEFNRESAEDILQNYIQYYLQAINLKPIDQEQTSYPLVSLAVRGKGLLTYAIAEHFSTVVVLEKLLSNDSMQLALGRLGFYEFLEINAHLAALFFEVLYVSAALQGKHDIRRKLEDILVGSDRSHVEKMSLVFDTED